MLPGSPKAAPGVPPKQVGRYTIYEQIASGGMATVHFAHFAGPLGFSRVVAAKRLHEHLVDDLDFRRMFVDEARLAARIRHPNVVPTLDVVVSDSEIILVMEYVHGESLWMLRRAARERKTPIPLGIATAILVSVLHGLHAAHEARSENGDALSIVHRDVSPQNILVGADGAVRVLDFGVAKAMQSRSETLAGMLKGKRSYMAPEVIRGEAVTRQADIFAAGIVLWELVTGKKLFSGANEQERLLKILAGNYPAPSLANPDLPAALDRIVMRALHPDVASRYSTALEMAVELETYLPPVSQRIVSEWVQGLAADTLEARAELLQQVEVSHINSVPASMSSLEVGEATRKVDSLESGSVRGGAKSVGAASIGWSKVAVAALFVTLAIVALFVRRPQPAPPPALASTLPAEAPPVASVGAAPLETVHPTPSSQDSTPTVARSPEASGSTKAAKRSRPPDRVPGSQRSDPARVPGTAHAQDFLPDQL